MSQRRKLSVKILSPSQTKKAWDFECLSLSTKYHDQGIQPDFANFWKVKMVQRIPSWYDLARIWYVSSPISIVKTIVSDKESTILYSLTCPSSSLFNWRNYISSLKVFSYSTFPCLTWNLDSAKSSKLSGLISYDWYFLNETIRFSFVIKWIMRDCTCGNYQTFRLTNFSANKIEMEHLHAYAPVKTNAWW